MAGWVCLLLIILHRSHGNPMKVQDGRAHVEVGTEIGPAATNGQDEGSSTESQSHMKVNVLEHFMNNNQNYYYYYYYYYYSLVLY